MSKQYPKILNLITITRLGRKCDTYSSPLTVQSDAWEISRRENKMEEDVTAVDTVHRNASRASILLRVSRRAPGCHKRSRMFAETSRGRQKKRIAYFLATLKACRARAHHEENRLSQSFITSRRGIRVISWAAVKPWRRSRWLGVDAEPWSTVKPRNKHASRERDGSCTADRRRLECHLWVDRLYSFNKKWKFYV